ncbi:hypothetical protein Taro_012143 [Colocasia esculenta]|uniref:Uncharacterized protein n=1 Tax=Colocasia esculenta TaxID=4460 RepID=A0A843UI82_COLES|nr:hypothetical protein [Colocasia esculenta]
MDKQHLAQLVFLHTKGITPPWIPHQVFLHNRRETTPWIPPGVLRPVPKQSLGISLQGYSPPYGQTIPSSAGLPSHEGNYTTLDTPPGLPSQPKGNNTLDTTREQHPGTPRSSFTHEGNNTYKCVQETDAPRSS